jgi:hypothetical protein
MIIVPCLTPRGRLAHSSLRRRQRRTRQELPGAGAVGGAREPLLLECPSSGKKPTVPMVMTQTGRVFQSDICSSGFGIHHRLAS